MKIDGGWRLIGGEIEITVIYCNVIVLIYIGETFIE